MVATKSATNPKAAARVVSIYHATQKSPLY
jgi:hypothetical protein